MKAKCWLYILVFFFFMKIIIPSLVNAEIRIMPLGASITEGSSSGVIDPDYMISYRKALWDLLDADGYEVNFIGSLNNGSAVFGDPDLADHEGHDGWRDDEIVNGRPGYGGLEDWLIAERPNIILIHVGTNALDPSPDDVEDILDLIDTYESNFHEIVWVILARIINRNIYSQTTTDFNDNVELLAYDRIYNPNNPAYPDNIIIVDMENGAGINYNLVTNNPPGDMWNNLHPFATGYEKMANVWFSGLQEILPVADAGSDQIRYEGNTVTLDASHSFDPDGMVVSYFWEQEPGSVRVNLSDLTVAKPTFTAPDVKLGGETLKFKVMVTDADGLESTDSTHVDVLPVVTHRSVSSGCFIETVTFRSLMRPHEKKLRCSKDWFSIDNSVVRDFVSFYYTYSPHTAEFIIKYSGIKAVILTSILIVFGGVLIYLKGRLYGEPKDKSVLI